jgi:uncharacterized Zn finger protein
MTIKLYAVCNRCGNRDETIEIEQVKDIIEEAERLDKGLDSITYRCGNCNAADAHKAMERIFS